jgi:hypothetical protein
MGALRENQIMGKFTPFQYVCGCSGSANSIEYYRNPEKFDRRRCCSCIDSEFRDVNAASQAAAIDAGFAKLDGTVRQRQWAETIRTNAIAAAREQFESRRWSTYRDSDYIRIVATLAALKSSDWLIKNRKHLLDAAHRITDLTVCDMTIYKARVDAPEGVLMRP